MSSAAPESGLDDEADDEETLRYRELWRQSAIDVDVPAPNINHPDAGSTVAGEVKKLRSVVELPTQSFPGDAIDVVEGACAQLRAHLFDDYRGRVVLSLVHDYDVLPLIQDALLLFPRYLRAIQQRACSHHRTRARLPLRASSGVQSAAGVACLPRTRDQERARGIQGRCSGRGALLGPYVRNESRCASVCLSDLTRSALCIQATREAWMALAHECDLAAEPGLQYCVSCGEADADKGCSACQYPFCSGAWCVCGACQSFLI